MCCCSLAKSCPTLCNPMDCIMPSFPVFHNLPEFAQTHIHWIGEAIQPFHPLSPLSPPALNLSQHQGHFQWVSSSYQAAKVLEFVSTSVLPVNIQDWFLLGWTGWISLQCRGLSKVSPTPQFKSINSLVLSFLYSPALPSTLYTWK